MGEFIVEIIFRYIIAGIWIGLKSAYNWIKEIIFGVSKIEYQRRELKKKWLYKKVILKVNLENSIKIGTLGTVIGFIGEKSVLVEFYDKNGDCINVDNKLTYNINLKHLIVKE